MKLELCEVTRGGRCGGVTKQVWQNRNDTIGSRVKWGVGVVTMGGRESRGREGAENKGGDGRPAIKEEEPPSEQ